MADNRAEFQKMQDKWDAAMKEGIFKTAKRPPVPAPDNPVSPTHSDYGMSPQMASVAANSEKVNDADYWNAIFRLSRGEQVDLFSGPSNGGEVLSESEKSPNPIPFWTKGKDVENRCANWFDLEDLAKLTKMKEDLHSLGDKAAKMGKDESVFKKIKNLQNEIDQLSDSLGQPKEEKRS